MNTLDIKGQLVDIHQERIYPARIVIQNGKIAEITRIESAPEVFIIPGFVDAHVHIESSMLTPCQFARLAVVHGTIATVSDPHEIGNVLGMEGVRYMIENGKMVPFYFNFGAPSCVPATIFETAGAEITVADVQELLQMEEVKYLAEMMNFPGVLQQDAFVMAKIGAAKKVSKPIDGHAPGLRGELALKYIEAGISTDHECFTAEEALDKLKGGMKILIREGSAAKNFEALIGLLPDYPDQMMFCSDDKHPDSLVAGHINVLAARAVAKGCNVFDVLQVACINPVLHYQLDSGLIRVGDNADLVVVQDLKSFKVLQTYIKGSLVAENGQTHIPSFESKIINHFDVSFKSSESFLIRDTGKQIAVIEAIDGQLITNKLIYPTLVQNGYIQSEVENDILKIAVVNRYKEAPVAIGFIKNMGLKEGALASSVAHDSHNIIVVGVDDESICKAVNLLIEAKGGLAAVTKHEEQIIPLPIAGLMTGVDGYQVAKQYENLDLMAKRMGSTLASPFMTLSFMALLVIPSLKLSDKGLFDGETFQFVPVVR